MYLTIKDLMNENKITLINSKKIYKIDDNKCNFVIWFDNKDYVCIEKNETTIKQIEKIMYERDLL